MDVLGVIPARYNSKRLPGKPLISLSGKSIIQRVYENSIKSRLIDELVVATDDRRIFDHVESFGGRAILTHSEFSSGTERCAFVSKSYNCKIVANIQGDEPFILPDIIDRCIEVLLEDENLPVSTAVHTGITEENLIDPNTVKVLINRRGEAIYFSRQNLPYIDPDCTGFNSHPALIHIGLYVYRKDFLLKLIEMPPSKLEVAEKLEQLRIIENGYPIKVVLTDKSTVGIDTLEDLYRAENLLMVNGETKY